ncbi:MAG: CoA transferase [Acidobacteria bacterium]|nr:CoA transferase [Acidobacteriota bacterium]
MRAVEGLRVLDLTRLLPGAVATEWLADFGADVIKIEQPGVGDYARSLFASIFEATNRGKRSVELDLKDASGRAALMALARTADVLIESFRPGVMDRLGVGCAALRAVNPRLIYVALTGYGQDGPRRDEAGHDINYLAQAGVFEMLGAVPGVQMADIAGGSMQAVIGVLLALAARERTGVGQFVDVSMTRGVAELLAIPLAELRTGGEGPGLGETVLNGGYACYNVYRCRDGRRLAVGALEPKFWAALCGALGRGDLVERQFAADQEGLKAELGAVFLRDDAEAWDRALRGHDGCVTLVRTVGEVAACDWLRLDQPAPRLSATPGRRGGSAPRLGEHTRDVLREAGIIDVEE